MAHVDTITDELTAPGAPFSVVDKNVNGRNIRVFEHAPENMSGIFDRARTYGDLEFVVSGDQRLTYEQFFEKADALTAWLVAQAQVTKGQSVAICMQNCTEWLLAFVAIINAGGVAVLVNSRGEPETMANAVADADSVLVFADEGRLPKLRQGGCQLPAVTTGTPDDTSTAFAQAKGGDAKIIGRDAKPEDIAAMMFTSGTTGRPKAAALTHRNLVTSVLNTELSMTAAFTTMARNYGMTLDQFRKQVPQSTVLLVFPLFHVSGCSSFFLTPMAGGARLVLMERWRADVALDIIERERITTFGGAPAMYWDMFAQDSFAKRDVSSVVSLVAAGQATSMKFIKGIRKNFPNAVLGGGYGMTETTGAISQANGEAFLARPTGSGFVLPMVDVRIVDDNGTDVEPEAVGEIWVRGATLMQGYYNRPEANAQSFQDGWFKTGDVGRIDADGVIYIVDRKTDMVISGGENIYCAEVEKALATHPDILEVIAFGAPDERLGERLVASAVVRNAEISADTLITHAKQCLAGYKIPTDFTLTTTPFEKNAMGKTLKKKIRAEYLEQNKTSDGRQ